MRALLKNSSKTAVTFRSEHLTYNRLLEEIEKYYQYIRKKKINKILILSENRLEYLYALYAGWKKGAIVVPVDHLATDSELSYIIKDCCPEMIFTSEENLAKIKKTVKNISHKIEILVFEKIKISAQSCIIEDLIINDISKTALLIYTSGTTGNPKGVMLSFENLIFNVDAIAEVGIYNEHECILMLLPIHHILPLLGTVFAPFLVQAKVAISPSTATEDILQTLCENRVTFLLGVPRLFEVIAKGIIEQINRSAIAKTLFRLAEIVNSIRFSKILFRKVHQKFGGSIKYIVSGGAPLDAEIIKNFTTLGFSVLEGYGMTETAPMITFPRLDNVKLGCTGQPLLETEVKTVDGEIWVKGKNVMQGYYNRPDETAEIIRDGWLRTGDIGELDKENFLKITGRKKEIIVLPNGKNINPSEIEEKILSLSDLIQESAVYLKENKLHAIIHFKKTEDTADPESEQKLAFQIISDYNRSVSSYKKIFKINLTHDELPKTRLGKLKRHELHIIETKTTRESVPEPKQREYAILRDYLQHETGMTISPNDHFELDLGLDSLSKVGLLVFLEKTFGIKLKDDHLSNYPNLLKLSGYVMSKKVKLQENIFNWSDILKEKVNVTLPKSCFTMGFFKYTGKFLFKLFFNLKGYGIKKIPAPPFILAPNHQSFLDGLFVAIFLKKKILKNTFFYAKSTHVGNRFLKFLAGVNNIIVMDINNDLKGSIQKLAKVLKDNKSVIIFPEGTRTHDGYLGEFKQTFAILSKELQIPVVPVTIWGAFEVLPKGKKFPKLFRDVTVDFLDPVFPGKKTYIQIIEQVKNSISNELEIHGHH